MRSARFTTFWRVLWQLLTADRFVAVAYSRSAPDELVVELTPAQDLEGAAALLRVALQGLQQPSRATARTISS